MARAVSGFRGERLASYDAVCVTQVVHVPYVVGQNEDGVWCASALLRYGVGAVGDGATPEEAVTDLRPTWRRCSKSSGRPAN